ncbi:transglutaminase family protein [Jiella avicenniae]|uniref:Transglutaminase family protein n=1 Tax=Jiella avicenniae TaxID=2907202 RepID=A0A9X1P0D9_9HYPH|nr:transglutaminase family protein [Jiella avicenniae]MCE7029130.1 transglutaminase family protein [Jiella avicenniae]
MKYAIRLKITYDYPSAVSDARHLLRVRPREGAGQTLRKIAVAITPRPGEHARERDFFGNAVDAIAFFTPQTELTVLMEATVTVERVPPPLAVTPGLVDVAEDALAARDADGASPLHHLGPSRRIETLPALTAYVEQTFQAAARPAGEAVLALTKRIREDFAYLPGSTSVGTSVTEAFTERRGVCQDFSHVMIAGLRANGIPARYVSGFLRTEPPEGQPRLEGADAMHAWVEAWLGNDIGWVGFDPTNGILAGDDHIVVAVGRDYSDALPIAGAFVTAGPQATDHFVDVVPIP